MSHNTPNDENRTDTTRHVDEAQRRVTSRADTAGETPAESAPYREISCGPVADITSNVRITTANDETSLTVTAIRDAPDATVDLRWATEPVSVGFTLDIEATRLLINALQAAVNEVDSEA